MVFLVACGFICYAAGVQQKTGTSHVSEPGYIISERSTVLYL